MQKSIVLFLVVLLSIVACATAKRPFRWHSDLSIYNTILNDDKLMEREDVRNRIRDAGIQYQWFTQRVDHFNPQNTDTFQQRYVVNNQYWNGNGPVFMMINGEGPMSLGTVTELQFVVWAEQFNALIISLEHRTYGASFVTEDLSTENLVYLSSQQALADNAVFRDAMAAQYNVPSTSQWVTFGGSYSGALTSWFRIKYPALVDFTVASSAPVNAEIDFYQYLEVVQNSLLTANNGQLCVDNIQAATQKIQSMIETDDGLDSINEQFDLSPPISSQNDIATFMQSLAGNFMGVVQYNLEEPGPAIQDLCNIMTNSSNDAYENYINVWNFFSGGQPMDVTYDTMIQESQNITNDANTIGGRMWFYQTCVEFGYYQTSTSSNQPFGDLFPIEYATQQCNDVFGFEFLPNVNWTLLDYGGLSPQESNILYVNGDIDPWHALGITTNTTAHNALLIHSTAHCADMMVPSSVSPSTLAPAQAVIESYLQKWLSN